MPRRTRGPSPGVGSRLSGTSPGAGVARGDRRERGPPGNPQARAHGGRGHQPALDARRGADPADRIGTVDLARALGGLKPDDRTLLALRFVAGLDSTEIAAQLHLSPSGVRSRLARLIERLRTELDHA